MGVTDISKLASCTSCTFDEDLSNYWTANVYFKARNGSYKRVPQMVNDQIGAANGGITVYYTAPGPNTVTAFKPVSCEVERGDNIMLTPIRDSACFPAMSCAGHRAAWDARSRAASAATRVPTLAVTLTRPASIRSGIPSRSRSSRALAGFGRASSSQCLCFRSS